MHLLGRQHKMVPSFCGKADTLCFEEISSYSSRDSFVFTCTKNGWERHLATYMYHKRIV